MDKPEYIQTIIQVAMMYYNDNLTQQEISSKLGMTRQSISKLLNEARTKGIVEINIINPLKSVQAISDKIVDRFKIKNAVTVPSDFDDDSMNRTIIAQKAVEHINSLISSGNSNIGISWGRTVYSFIKIFISENHNNQLNVFPLVGASNENAPYFMINEMVRIFSEKTKAKPTFIYIPVNPGSSEEYGLFSRTRAYREISQIWKNTDIAVVGIGSLKAKSRSVRQEYPGEDVLALKMENKDPVGDICTNYFDLEGNIIKPDDYLRLISINEDELRNIKNVVALAGGLEKVEAIIGALRTGLISDIIIDEITAREVLKRS